ncbi:RteC domain-containing protein [Chitinophaga filiformis]|uniref:RteC domain-containing protein n=1 Tax=Chitinophaga filiformis TaxID=104663 RepID=A0ABY4HWQ4_CHIFI|nr:RteC domain-containing protein [Chitinophaga filiformis]UPK68035.1 RteC domain-containing protein [Chitinophaga filiformis]
MKTAPAQLLEQLLAKLDSLTSEEDLNTTQLQKAIDLTAASLEEVKKQVTLTGFADTAEEITFFKHIKPEFDARLMHFLRLTHLLVREPASGAEAIRNYYGIESKAIDRYFDAHSEFYLYHRMQHTYLDNYYFVRQQVPYALHPYNYYWMHDQHFNAPMSLQLATIKAHEMMAAYINHRLWLLAQQLPAGSEPATERPLLTWTGSKAALTELIVALQEHGVFNNTRVPLKKLADYFSKVFNIKLGNIFKIYEDNRLRKKGRKPFLDALANSYIRRLETDDENSL